MLEQFALGLNEDDTLSLGTSVYSFFADDLQSE